MCDRPAPRGKAGKSRAPRGKRKLGVLCQVSGDGKRGKEGEKRRKRKGSWMEIEWGERKKRRGPLPSFLPPQTLTWRAEKQRDKYLGAMVPPRKNGNRGLVFCLAKKTTWQTLSVFSVLSQILLFFCLNHTIPYLPLLPNKCMVFVSIKET